MWNESKDYTRQTNHECLAFGGLLGWYAPEKIVENFHHKQKDYKPILEIIDRHLLLHLDRPLLGAEVFLNPCVYYIEIEKEVSFDDLYLSAFQDVVERMVKNKKEHIQIMLGIESLKQKRGKFGTKMAK